MDGQGVVVSVRGNKASVRVSGETVEGGCAGCAGKTQCYSAGHQGREITVLNDFGAEVDDRVVFEVDPGKVVLSSFLIWIVPLLAMFVGYLAGERLGAGIIPIVAAFLFMALTFALLKILDKAISGGRSFYPRITTILDPAGEASSFCENKER